MYHLNIYCTCDRQTMFEKIWIHILLFLYVWFSNYMWDTRYSNLMRSVLCALIEVSVCWNRCSLDLIYPIQVSAYHHVKTKNENFEKNIFPTQIQHSRPNMFMLVGLCFESFCMTLYVVWMFPNALRLSNGVSHPSLCTQNALKWRKTNIFNNNKLLTSYSNVAKSRK